MCEVYLQTSVLKKRKSRELRAVIACDGFEHLIISLRELRHDSLQHFRDCLGGMVLSLNPDAHSCHALDKREDTRLIFILFADDCVNLPVIEFGARIHDLRAFFDAPTENFLVFTDSFCFGVTAELLGQVNGQS